MPAVGVGLLLGAVVLGSVWLQPTSAAPQKDVTICHRTNAVSAPYAQMTVDANSILREHGPRVPHRTRLPQSGLGRHHSSVRLLDCQDSGCSLPRAELGHQGHRHLGSRVRRPAHHPAGADRVPLAARDTNTTRDRDTNTRHRHHHPAPPAAETPTSTRRDPTPPPTATPTETPTPPRVSPKPDRPRCDTAPARGDHAAGTPGVVSAPPAPGLARSRCRDHAGVDGGGHRPRSARGLPGAVER